MQGHTDRATINQRRPLTTGMVNLLRSVEFRKDQLHPCIFHGELLQAERNAARALLDRGMLDWDIAMRGYFLTDKGREALASQPLSAPERQE